MKQDTMETIDIAQDLSNCVIIWDVETTELIDRKKCNISDMEVSVACALIFDAFDKNLENATRRTFWHSSVTSLSTMNDLCSMLASCKAHVAFNGLRFDMIVMKKHFCDDANYQSALKRLHDPYRDISMVGSYSLNSLLITNGLSPKTASGKEAPKMWKEGRYEELESYCMSDVELLAELVTKADSVKIPLMHARIPLSISTALSPQMYM